MIDKAKFIKRIYSNKELDEIKDDLNWVIYDCLEKVGNVLTDNNIPFEHKERIKSIYGLYKQLNKGRKIVDVHDLVAIKLMVDDINDCFRTLGFVHSVYPPINEKFKDYIFSSTFTIT